MLEGGPGHAASLAPPLVGMNASEETHSNVQDLNTRISSIDSTVLQRHCKVVKIGMVPD